MPSCISDLQSFELLMTFYTPDTYAGPPGSSQAVQVVSADDVPRESAMGVVKPNCISNIGVAHDMSSN